MIKSGPFSNSLEISLIPLPLSPPHTLYQVVHQNWMSYADYTVKQIFSSQGKVTLKLLIEAGQVLISSENSPRQPYLKFQKIESKLKELC